MVSTLTAGTRGRTLVFTLQREHASTYRTSRRIYPHIHSRRRDPRQPTQQKTASWSTCNEPRRLWHSKSKSHNIFTGRRPSRRKSEEGPHPREADCFHCASLLERPRCSVRRCPRACSALRRGGGRGGAKALQVGDAMNSRGLTTSARLMTHVIDDCRGSRGL